MMRILEDYLLVDNIGFVPSFHDDETLLLYWFFNWDTNGFPIGVITKGAE